MSQMRYPYDGHTYALRSGLEAGVKEMENAWRQAQRAGDPDMAAILGKAADALAAAQRAVQEADKKAGALFLRRQAKAEPRHEQADDDDSDLFPCGCCRCCGCDCGEGYV